MPHPGEHPEFGVPPAPFIPFHLPMALKPWLLASRPRTLPLSFLGILFGVLLSADHGVVNGWLAGLVVLVGLCLQILSNLANDYGDAAKGVDGSLRTGERRTVSSGLISPRSMKRAIIVLSVFSFALGVLLLFTALPGRNIEFFIFLGAGGVSIVAALQYTLGKRAYGYVGLGDLAVLLFFGIIGVYGTFLLLGSRHDPEVLLAAASYGLLCVGVLNLNNLRDIDSDRLGGKITIPGLLGFRGGVVYHALLVNGAAGSFTVFVIFQPGWTLMKALMLALIHVVLLAHSVRIWRRESNIQDSHLGELIGIIFFFFICSSFCLIF